MKYSLREYEAEALRLYFSCIADALHCNQERKTTLQGGFPFLVAEVGFESHGLAKFSAENLASVTSRL